MWRSLGVPVVLAAFLVIAGSAVVSSVGNADFTGVKRGRRSLAQASSTEFFVTVGSNLNFYLGCNKFFVAGWNQWEMVEAGAGAPILYGATIPAGVTGPELIRSGMDKAVENGLNVIRAFATAVDAPYNMQTSPGVFNEAVFRGLDYVLDQARQRGIKLILALIDNWANPGGIDQLVAWSGSATKRSQFFADANCQRLYKQLVEAIITRTNTINGRKYSKDPTIMAWNLINEPRCENCGDDVQAWIEMMAAYVRTLDTDHLLTVGEEGFYGPTNRARSDYANPQGPTTWALNQGQDFLLNHQVPGIDFASMHLWPDNWLDQDTAFVTAWLTQHDLDGQTVLQRPVVLEEFGKWIKNTTAATAAQRQEFYKVVYDYVQTSANNGSVKGVAFWQWINEGQEAPAAEGGGKGLYGISAGDASWSIITDFAKSVAGLTSDSSSCLYSKPSDLPPVPTCSNTWVKGISGSGYEGPSCDIDVNECVRGIDNCAANAGCVNTNGSFVCQCYYGYTGDGTNSCTPTAVLDSLAGGYTTSEGMLACPEDDAKPVDYPKSAPGYVDDPTGATSQNGTGSILSASLQDCQIACETASGCDSFTYNPVQLKCYLKNGSPKKTCEAIRAYCTSSNQDLQPQTFDCGKYQTYYRTAGAVGSVIQPAVLSSTAG